MREGYSSCLMCVLCIGMSVPVLAASAYVYTCNQRDIENTFHSKVMAWKSQYANELELTASRFRAVSGPTKQQLSEGQLVCPILLQRLATGETGMKQARYRRGIG